VRQRNSKEESLRVVQIARGLCAKTPERARSACIGLAQAKLSPSLLMLFLFLPDLGNS
jgi:hypothetical protein